MTVRVYLEAARFLPGPSQPGDLPLERVFVHAADVRECWVETESLMVPDPGRLGSFFLPPSLELGFQRVVGTIERCVDKETKGRLARASFVAADELAAGS